VLCLILTTAHLCAQGPLARLGKIKLVGNQLSSECGSAIQLRGISSFGPQFNPNCYNNNSLDAIANDWHADVFRIAMSVNEGGNLNDSSYWKS
jgi:endoglucanase